MADGSGPRTFVGRDAELARLHAELGIVAGGGGGRSIVVAGEAGIGKSRLIERFAEEINGTARALIGACLEVADDALPYGPFVEILRAIVRETPEGQLPAVLGPGRAELTQLLPELATRSADLGPIGEGRASQARLFELVLGVLERLAATQPAVMVIDDVQWADRSTHDLIGFLSRALRDDPVLLILGVRTDAGGAAVGNLAFVAELEREDHVDRLDVGPFDRDLVAEQVTNLLGEPAPPGLVDRLVERTDGNPFYVEELIHASAPDQGLPPVLRDVLAARVGGLSPQAREILRAAAAAGRRIDDALLAATLSMAPRDLAAGLREALASGVLARVQTPAGVVSEFRHALLQEVVDAELFAGERAELHASFAGALEERLASGDRVVATVEIGRHWDAAGRPGRALPYLVQAASAAQAVYAFAEAERLWARAAEILEAESAPDVAGHDLADLLDRAGDCALLAGDPRRAAALLQRAVVHAYPSGDLQRIHELESRLRWHLWWAGERAEAAAAIERALPGVPPGSGMARAGVLAQLAAVQMLEGAFEESAEAAREAIQIAETAGRSSDVALAYGVLGSDLAMLGEVEVGLAEFQKGQAIAEATGSVEGIAIAATNLAALLDRIGRSEACLETAESGYRMTERYGVARTFGAELLGYAAKAQLALGRWDDVDRSTAMGLRRGAIDAGAVWLQVNRARLLIGRGDMAGATVLLRRARGTDERLGGTAFSTALLAAEAELAAWSGDLSGALRAGEAGLARLLGGGPPDASLAWVATLVVRAIADGGRSAPPGAPALIGAIDGALQSVAGRRSLAGGDRAAVVLAQIGAERGRLSGTDTAAQWADVARRWEALARPFNVGYARYREAAAGLRDRGDREEAAAALREAWAIAGRLGAGPLADLAGTLAAQARIALPEGLGTGEAASSGPRRPLDGLTARESEVLRLVAAGWTNQQIADALFITRKTASVHVSNIIAKLDVANRGEAAALAYRHGMVAESGGPASG